MFKVNDYVIYNSTGAYKITDIRKEKDFNEQETEYYILEPVFNNNMTVKIPVNNPKVSLRQVMTREQVLELINRMPEKESIWIEDNRERNENFKAALKTAESEEWVKLIKSIYLEKQEKQDQGKKIAKTDEEIMQAAEKNLHEEFAVALNISPDEVLSFILKRIS